MRCQFIIENEGEPVIDPVHSPYNDTSVYVVVMSRRGLLLSIRVSRADCSWLDRL